MRRQLKKQIEIVIAFLAIAFLFALMGIGAGTANAATISEADVSTPSSGCVFLGVEGIYYTDAQAALDRINEIRYEACTEGDVPDPRDSSRMLTESDYVPIKWSTDLERIARVRAYESALTVAHARVNGKSIWTIRSNGVSSYSEVLAWNYSTSMVTGVNQWYSEKEDWIEQTGEVTGHYTAMINPNNSYVGLGDFYTSYGNYRNTTAGEFNSSSAELDQTMLSGTGTVIQKVEVLQSNITGYNLTGDSEVYENKTQQLTLKAAVLAGSYTRNLLVLDGITYESSDTDVAEVDENGIVTGKEKGKATITALIDGTEAASLEISVVCEHSYTYSEVDEDNKITATCTKCGESTTLTAPTSFEVYWKNSTSADTGYSSAFPSSNPIDSSIICWLYYVNGDDAVNKILVECSDPTVLQTPEYLTVGSDNSFKVLKAGAVTIKIYAEYNPSVYKTITCLTGSNGEIDILDADVTLTPASYVHNNSFRKPTVSVSYHGMKLTNGTHFSVTYANNYLPGTATVTITGLGYFAGSSKVVEFQITHDMTYKEGKAATCTEAGTRDSYYCSVCKKYFADEEGLTGLSDFTIPATGHTIVTDAAVAATCTESGLTEGSHCERCGYVEVAQEIIPATSHSEYQVEAIPADCTTAGMTEGTKCSVCGTIITGCEEVPAYGHTPQVVAGTAATCTEDGLSDGSFCSVCGETITEQTIIPKLGHSYETEKGYAATCTEDGLTDRIYCTWCGEVQEEAEVIPATGHTIVTDAAVEANCTESGLTEGSHCENCGMVFKSQEVIPTIDHSEYQVEAIPADCTTAGMTAGTKCSVCGTIITGCEEVPANGHTPQIVAGTAATCTENGLSDGSFCSVCGETLKEQTVLPATGHIIVTDAAVEATCTESGLTEGNHCSVCGETITAQTVIPMLGHRYETEKGYAATCTEEGLTDRIYCARCGEVQKEAEVIPATGHTIVTDAAVAATCTESGLTEGSHCSVCGETITAQTVIPMLGHNYETEKGYAATCTEEGLTDRVYCAR